MISSHHHLLTIQSLENLCRGYVAVVGNGPLLDSDRAEIEDYDCVVRFNHVANWRQGERFDLHVSRSTNGKFTGIHRNEGRPILPVAVSDALAADASELKGRTILPTLRVFERRFGDQNTLTNDTRLFARSDCGSECFHSATAWGPSTGASAIDALEKSPGVKKIDIYGMNWNGDHGHVDFKYPHIVPKHCTKCHVHDTRTINYRP